LKTKTLKKDKVGVVTLGCSKNLVDSEEMVTQLRAGAIDVEHSYDGQDSNVIIVNTCGFIDKAKEESVDTILHFANERKRGKIDKLYVTGCLSERYRDDLEKEIPEVDAYFGTMELPLLLEKFKVDYKHELVGERMTATPLHYAYLKISEGCNRTCSFCAIPLMRGGHRSKPIEELVSEARGLAARGVREIMLIAQELTYYGLDLYKERALPKLLHKLADVDGIEWIRLHYAYPSKFPTEILDVMAEREEVCNYLDIPLQHASDKVLKMMRRQITRRETEELLDLCREKVPGIHVRTTMLVGHPGEGRKEFEELIDFVKAQRFDRLGVFTYSHEEGTRGFEYEDNVPEETKSVRAKELMEIQMDISDEINQKKIGKTFKTLIDRKEGGHFVGRTEADSPEVDNEVLISAKENYLRIGDFANVRITDASEYDLFGVPV
jgi:ribosomal protein S12 methylthiotransferase